MAGYWLKLYTEVLDDIKYYRLSDNAKLAMYELMLIAKRTGDNGALPSIEEIIFATHGAHSAEWWSQVIQELKSISFLVESDGVEKIRKFEDRQSPIADNDRQKLSREKKHKNEFNHTDVTNLSRDCHEPVTNLSRNVTEKERKKEIDIDKERDREIKKEIGSSLSDSPVRYPSNEEVDAWNKALGDLQSSMSKAQYDSYIAPLKLEVVENNVFKARAINKISGEWVQRRCGGALNGYLTGWNGKQSKFEVIV